MVLGKLFGKLGGSKADAVQKGEAVEHDGYLITPVPRMESGQYYIAGTISKTIDGETREHAFVRADTHGDFQTACDHTVQKARQIIKEQGDRIFRD